MMSVAYTNSPFPAARDDHAGVVRFSSQPIEAVAGGPARFALVVGVHPRQVYRWRRSGLTEAQADMAAIRCGYHPAEIWDEW